MPPRLRTLRGRSGLSTGTSVGPSLAVSVPPSVFKRIRFWRHHGSQPLCSEQMHFIGSSDMRLLLLSVASSLVLMAGSKPLRPGAAQTFPAATTFTSIADRHELSPEQQEQVREIEAKIDAFKSQGSFAAALPLA